MDIDIGIYIHICIGYITINGNIGDIPSLMSGCLIGYATPCLWVNGSMGQAWFSAGVCGELITLRMKGIPMMMGWPLAFDPMMWPWNTDRWFSMAFNNPSFGKNWGDAQFRTWTIMLWEFEPPQPVNSPTTMSWSVSARKAMSSSRSNSLGCSHQLPCNML